LSPAARRAGGFVSADLPIALAGASGWSREFFGSLSLRRLKEKDRSVIGFNRFAN
jgi:hypothetical protein